MEERIIPIVNNNQEKEVTYRNRMGKYNQAIKYGFYCEAVMITYAMIEDRLRSMIYHMGFLANRQATFIWKRTRPVLGNCVEKYKTDEEDLKLGINTLSGKTKIVRCVYLWAMNTNNSYGADRYMTVLKSQIEGTDIDEVLKTLEEIEKWKSCRNEIVHAMMNKNNDKLEEILKPHAIEGMSMARSLDNQVKKLKEGNKIRRAVNLPMK